MRFVLPLLAAAAVSITIPAWADETGREASSEVEKPKAEDEKICKRVALEMGSRRKERVCMTAKEWREFNSGR